MAKRLTEWDVRIFVYKWLNEHPKDLHITLLQFCEEHYLKNKDITQQVYTVIKKLEMRQHFYASILTEKIDIENEFNHTSEGIENGIEDHFPPIKNINDEKNQMDLVKSVFPNEKWGFPGGHQEHLKNKAENLLKLEEYNYLIPVYPYYLDFEIDRWMYCVYLGYWILSVNEIKNELIKQFDVEFRLSDDVLSSIRLRLGPVDFSDLSFESLEERKVLVNKLIFEYANKEKETTTVKKETTKEQEEPNTELEESNQFNNVPIHTVREIFSVLKETKNKEGKHFLDEASFEEFVSCAFLGKKLKRKIKIDYNPDSETVRLKYLFFVFRAYSRKKHYEPRSKKLRVENYVSLFTDFFISTQTVDSFKSQWSKKPKKEYVLLNLEDIKENKHT